MLNTGDGLKNIKFHVQGILSDYNKERIQNIKATVASITGCDIKEIVEKEIRHSNSFLLVLSMKEIYATILSELDGKDRLKLMKLNIDYLIDDLDNVHYMFPKGNSLNFILVLSRQLTHQLLEKKLIGYKLLIDQ